MYKTYRPALALLIVLFVATTQAESALDLVEQEGIERSEEGRAAQERIDAVSDNTRNLVDDFRAELKLVDGLEAYIGMLDVQLRGQEEETNILQQSIADVAVIERQILPMMARMIDSLDSFIQLDVPFLTEERQARVDKLRELLQRSDVTVAEEEMRDIVSLLVEYYPREQYLMNLAALHGQLGDVPRQLALVESLLDDGRLQKQNHLTLLANLFLAEGRPHKAAVLLEMHMGTGTIEATVANLELLSQAWYNAADPVKALPPLEQAAELSDDGDLYLRVARLHMDAYDWSAAEKAARAALDKGGLRQEGQAWLVRGMAKVRLEQFNDARTLLERAAEFDDVSRYAEQWLAWMTTERERREALGQPT